MSGGCQTCGGFDYKHDPVAHGLEDQALEDEGEYEARRDVVARYLAYEYDQPIGAARVRASELMAIVQTWIA